VNEPLANNLDNYFDITSRANVPTYQVYHVVFHKLHPTTMIVLLQRPTASRALWLIALILLARKLTSLPELCRWNSKLFDFCVKAIRSNHRTDKTTTTLCYLGPAILSIALLMLPGEDCRRTFRRRCFWVSGNRHTCSLYVFHDGSSIFFDHTIIRVRTLFCAMCACLTI